MCCFTIEIEETVSQRRGLGRKIILKHILKKTAKYTLNSSESGRNKLRSLNAICLKRFRFDGSLRTS